MKERIATVVGSVFGIGFIPFAPGTFGSLAAALAYLFIPVLANPFVLLVLLAVVTAAGIWAGGLMERKFGEDPSATVVDELAGQWVALIAMPVAPVAVALSFLFFRLYDIVKPGPVDHLQRLPGGWGIMADDLLAGLLANLSVRLLVLLLPSLPYGFSL